MIYITSYDCPDLDGVACMVGYAELLEKTGRAMTPVYSGDLGLETRWVEKYAGSLPISPFPERFQVDDQFVLVDTSDPGAIDKRIDLENVIEIFDHRELAYKEKFPNAKTRIELVGSCATLIAEQFLEKNVEPSKLAAVYLFAAIVSNTINFKNSVTTDRDRAAATYLKGVAGIGNDFVVEMFRFKSELSKNNLYDVLWQDFHTKDIGGKRVGVAQIEIVDLESKVDELKLELVAALEKLKLDNKVDYILFTGVDIAEGFNVLVLIDSVSRDFFAKVLELPNLVSGYKTSKIIMRKQIWPKVAVALGEV